MGSNCRNKAMCPMPGKCTTDKLIYRATMTTNNLVEKYVGLTANKFKDRYGGHKQDFERTLHTVSIHIEAKKRK